MRNIRRIHLLILVIVVVILHIFVKIIFEEFSNVTLCLRDENIFRQKQRMRVNNLSENTSQLQFRSKVINRPEVNNRSEVIKAPATKTKITSRKIPISTKLPDVNINDISCYNKPTHVNGLEELNYSKGKDAPELGKSIFFLETSCFGEGELFINARQACAVESAAKMNPTMSVYLLIFSPSKISKPTEKLFRQLLSYKNVKIKRIIADKYVKNTPLEKWYNSGILNTSHWRRVHTSDAMRYLTLWKYGGIYLDLDVVITKSLENLVNFAGAEDWRVVAVGVIGFGMNNLGRRIAEDCLEDLKKNFRGNFWGSSGPLLLTRVLKKICNAQNPRGMMSVSQCKGFQVFPPTIFYPILHIRYKKYFETKDKNETMKIIEKAKAIHVWNKLSHEERIKVGSQVPYEIVAQKYCPKVYSNCGEFF